MKSHLVRRFAAAAAMVWAASAAPAQAGEARQYSIIDSKQVCDDASLVVPQTVPRWKCALDGHLSVILDISSSMGRKEREAQARFADAFVAPEFLRMLDSSPRGILVRLFTLAGNTANPVNYLLRSRDDIPALQGWIRETSLYDPYEGQGHTDVYQALSWAVDTMISGSHWAPRNTILILGDAAVLHGDKSRKKFPALARRASLSGIRIDSVPFATDPYAKTLQSFTLWRSPAATYTTHCDWPEQKSNCEPVRRKVKRGRMHVYEPASPDPDRNDYRRIFPYALEQAIVYQPF